jgi:beta-mannosidase
MELEGRWVAVEADDEVRRHAIGLHADDDTWHEIDVPGHWRDHPKFATSDGPVMYRHHFEATPPEDGRRRWITLDGIFYQADVWLDGAYLGDPEGYFFSHTFDITALSRLGHEHALAVEVTCDPQPGPTRRTNITGVFQQWDGIDHGWNPGGIWRPIHLHDTGPVRVDRLRVLCRDADDRRAHLRLAVRLDSDVQQSVLVRTLVDDEVADEQEHVIANGDNDIEWSLDVDHPSLWWPCELGEQPLSAVAVEVLIDGEPSDRRERRIGLRQIEWDNWICTVNGERLFLKGANILPATAGLANADDDRSRRDIELARELGLNTLRVHGHIADRGLYRDADELGMLLLQDFPLQWGQARSVRRRAVEQARAAVDSLGHHPSIALWTAHNDPGSHAARLEGGRVKGRARTFAAQQLPSWNKTVLDRWVKRSFEKSDPSRMTVAHSGVAPHLPQLAGTDSHLYFGWLHGAASDLSGHAARVPRQVRFVSEFGAGAVPETAPYIDEQLRTRDWPDLDWDHLAEAHGYQRDVFERRADPKRFGSFDSWRRATQRYQAYVLKNQIETLRRLKYRPTGGFCFYALADPSPVISDSILDHERVPKAAFDVVTAACAPILVVADQPPTRVKPGSKLRLDVHVVSDLREPIDFAVVDATATWAGGSRAWRFGGPIPADDVVKVGRIEMRAPAQLGDLAFELTMKAGDHESHNRYRTAVTVPSP